MARRVTNVPGSRVRSAFGTVARNETLPVAGSTTVSEKSSVPVRSSARPFGSTICTVRWPALASSTLPSPWACWIACSSLELIEKLAYSGSIWSIVVSSVASPWPTSAPSVTCCLPARPAIGAVTLA